MLTNNFNFYNFCAHFLKGKFLESLTKSISLFIQNLGLVMYKYKENFQQFFLFNLEMLEM